MPTISVLSKNKKNITFFSAENYHFYIREILQYIARTCLRNVAKKTKKNETFTIDKLKAILLMYFNITPSCRQRVRTLSRTCQFIHCCYIRSVTILELHVRAVTAHLPRQFEPRRQKTGLRGLRPGPTQTGLGNH